jgi:hypothetical protein
MQDPESINDERPSDERVSGYLECIDQQRARARRTRFIAVGVGIVTAAVAYLTPPEARNLVASAGAIAVSVALGKS